MIGNIKFDNDEFLKKELNIFLKSDEKFAYISGPSGSGKTIFITEFFKNNKYDYYYLEAKSNTYLDFKYNSTTKDKSFFILKKWLYNSVFNKFKYELFIPILLSFISFLVYCLVVQIWDIKNIIIVSLLAAFSLCFTPFFIVPNTSNKKIFKLLKHKNKNKKLVIIIDDCNRIEKQLEKEFIKLFFSIYQDIDNKKIIFIGDLNNNHNDIDMVDDYYNKYINCYISIYRSFNELKEFIYAWIDQLINLDYYRFDDPNYINIIETPKKEISDFIELLNDKSIFNLHTIKHLMKLMINEIKYGEIIGWEIFDLFQYKLNHAINYKKYFTDQKINSSPNVDISKDISKEDNPSLVNYYLLRSLRFQKYMQNNIPLILGHSNNKEIIEDAICYLHHNSNSKNKYEIKLIKIFKLINIGIKSRLELKDIIMIYLEFKKATRVSKWIRSSFFLDMFLDDIFKFYKELFSDIFFEHIKDIFLSKSRNEFYSNLSRFNSYFDFDLNFVNLYALTTMIYRHKVYYFSEIYSYGPQLAKLIFYENKIDSYKDNDIDSFLAWNLLSLSIKEDSDFFISAQKQLSLINIIYDRDNSYKSLFDNLYNEFKNEDHRKIYLNLIMKTFNVTQEYALKIAKSEYGE